MDCLEYQHLISAQLDGDMTPADIIEAERHLGSCARCAVVYNDLRTIVAEAQHLPPFVPDERLWLRLRAQCENENLVRTPSKPAWRWAGWFQIQTWPKTAWATGFLAVLVVSASIWLFSGLPLVRKAPSRDAAAEVQATNEVRLAEQNYLQAIDSLQKITDSRMAQMDPGLKSVLEDNLATIDYYIDKCRESVKNEPSNALAQRYLLEAYRKKVDLLASIVHSDVL